MITKKDLTKKKGKIALNKESIVVSIFHKDKSVFKEQKPNESERCTVQGVLEMSSNERALSRKLYQSGNVSLITLTNKTLGTPEEFANLCDFYFKLKFDEKQEVVTGKGDRVSLSSSKPLTLEGLCNYLGITVNTFNLNYLKGDSFKEYHQIAALAKQIIAENLLEGAILKNYDSRITMMYLNNRSDLKSEKELAINAGGTPQVGNNTFNFISFENRDGYKEYKEIKENNDNKDNKEIINVAPL